MKYLVGDMVNGTLKTFSTLAEAEECFADYIEDGNRMNAENASTCIGQGADGEDEYPALEDAAEFYYIQEMEEVKKLKL